MHFSASSHWLAAVFDELERYQVDPLFPEQVDATSGAFGMVSLLLLHDGSNEFPSFLRSCADCEMASRVVTKRLTCIRDATSLSAFQACLDDRFLGVKLEKRQGAVRIQSTSLFTERFQPPSADRAAAAVRQILEKVALLRGQQASKTSLALLAAIEYALFLTIHPFVDGNGRTARLVFASRVMFLDGAANLLLLALVHLHRSRGRAFHLCMQALRMGSPIMLLEEVRNSFRFVEKVWSNRLHQLSVLNDRDDECNVDALAELRAIHSWARKELFSV